MQAKHEKYFDAVTLRTEEEAMPFPYGNRPYCHYEPIEKSIESATVLVVNNLLRNESDLSDLAKKEWAENAEPKLRLENKLSAMACDNIAKNVSRLVKQPEVRTAHLSEIASAVDDFKPEAIVLSGTLNDFDYYNPEHLKTFADFVQKTQIPILAICGGHQLVGVSFGAKLTTLDDFDPSQKRAGRLVEYQYRFVKITDDKDPIFAGVLDEKNESWQDYTKKDEILRVWQNHGLQVDGIPDGFTLLATSYLCKNQMMVRNADGQMIYGVQFHLEKSFEDWNKNPTRWEHPNDSRDGRVLFENFLKLAKEQMH